MRVTRQTLVNNFLRNLNETNSDLFDVNAAISSGKRVERPEDDAVSAATITRINSQLSETNQFKENILQSLSELNTVDSTFGDVSSILIRTRELAVQAANATLSQDERDAIAVEVNQLLESMVQIGNSTVGGSILFSGHESGSNPFEVVRGSDVGEVKDIVTIDGETRVDINANNITRVLYKGDGERSSIEVDNELTVNSNITGEELFFYDTELTNSGPVLSRKNVTLTGHTLLENIVNTKNEEGVSQGYLYVRNTRGLVLREDTNPDPAVDNSTRLLALNNGRGVGRDQNGNVVSLGHVTITDSAGVGLTVDTNVAPINTDTATVEDVIGFLNAQIAAAAAPRPQMRFFMENGRIQFVDNAGGAGIPNLTDHDIDNNPAGQNVSTFVQDLGLSAALRPKTIDSAVTQVGLFNEFGGIRFSGAEENMTGRIEFTTGPDFIEIVSGEADGQRLVYDDGAGLRTELSMPTWAGSLTLNDIITGLNNQLGQAKAVGDIDTAAGTSSFTVRYPDGNTETIDLNAMTAGVATDVTGNNIAALAVGAGTTLNDIHTQLRNRVVRQDLNSTFTVFLNDGNSYNFNLGKTTLNQSSTLDDVLNELNNQSSQAGPTGIGVNGFQLSADGQRIELLGAAAWGAVVDGVVDQGQSTAALDLSIRKPSLTVNSNFPNVAQQNQDFPGLFFDERTLLSDWTGEFNIASSINQGSIRVQDSSGKEYFVNLIDPTVPTPANPQPLLTDQSTVEDFIKLFNSQIPTVEVGMSPSGYGLRFIDKAEGTGKLFIEDANGSELVNALGLETPNNGAAEEWDVGGGVLVDLTSVGDLILSVDDLLTQINDATQKIGVEAHIDEVTSQLVFEDVRNPDLKGKFRVSAENAVGMQTPLENLNDGGGINNYKIRVTDSRGISTIIDFQQANTIEDVITAINISNEAVDEKTPLNELEGIRFPLGTVRVTTSSGSVDVDLSVLNQSSTVQDFVDTFKGSLSSVQADMNLILNLDQRNLQFEFKDLLGGEDNGNISIQDVTGSASEDFNLTTVAQSSPYTSGKIVHNRAQVKAGLNDERTGLKIVDLNGGELRVTEVEGRTTAHDLGLISLGVDVGSSAQGVLRGRNLNAFEKIGDELGISKDFVRSITRPEDVGSARANEGAINDRVDEIRSVQLNTRSLRTLAGSVDMNHSLTAKTPLAHLNNAAPQVNFNGNPIEGVDLTGVLRIESILDDGNNNYQGIILDFNQLPDNPTFEDLDEMIQKQIGADESFEAGIQMQITTDGKIKFVSDYPIRIGRDNTAVGTAAQNAATLEDMFGTNAQDPSDFEHSITTDFLGVSRILSGGIQQENFFIDDYGGTGSLEVDLNRISYEKQKSRRGLELGDVKEYVELNSQKPNILTTNTLLEDLGLELPANIPFDGASAVETDTVAPFNGLTETSTLGDFITAFNASPANSIFNGTVTLEIADSTNTNNANEIGRRIFVRDQVNAVLPDTPATLTINGIQKGVQDFLDKLGIKIGGTSSVNVPGTRGIMGEQITGLGYKVSMDVDPKGIVSMKGEGTYDSAGKFQVGSGRIAIIEGDSSTATDLKLIQGTGAIGDSTRNIHSGDLNPGVDRNSLLSEIMPNDQGKRTSFEDSLRSVYVENGKESAFIELTDPPVTLDTPFKAFQNGRFDETGEIYLGGIDTGRVSSGFVIEDQFGNQTVVDLSNNLSQSTNVIDVANLTGTDVAPAGASPIRLTGAAGDFSNANIGEFMEFTADGTNIISENMKFKITNVDAAGAFIEIDADPALFGAGIGAAGNYSARVFSDQESLSASLEKDYRAKPFYNENSTLRDLQNALDVAIDKAKRTTGFGIDRLVIVEDKETRGYRINVFGDSGPTITIRERDVNGDGKADSSTAGDLGLLREVGAKGNGSPQVTAGPLKVTSTLGYVLDRVNQDLSDVNVTASIGNSGSGPTIDITSNTDSSYIKVRDTQEGNTASQLGMTSTRSIFQTLIDFRDSLYRNDSKTISGLVLQNIGDDEEKVLQLRAQVGSIVNRFEVNVDRLESTNIELTKRLSDHQDLDLTDAIVNLRKLETAQQAALSVGSRIIQTTLLDFLR